MLSLLAYWLTAYMLINLYIFLHMQNGCICLAAAEAAGAPGGARQQNPPSQAGREMYSVLVEAGPCL